VACTYDRPAKKRGTKSGYGKVTHQEGSSSHDEKRDAQMLLELTNGNQASEFFSATNAAIPEKWRLMMEANEAKIRGLVDVYFEVVYPMCVFLHAPSLFVSVSTYLPRDPNTYACFTSNWF
jgi:hypothetical protein